MTNLLELVFYSAVAASVLNPIAGSGPLTNEAMYLLATELPETHQRVVRHIKAIEWDSPLVKVAGLGMDTGILYVNQADEYRENAARWAGVLAHEAYHGYAKANCQPSYETVAILQEWATAKRLGASDEWLARRWQTAWAVTDKVSTYC
ncbi:MAG: hypothetical protein ACE5JL_00340 [Dehalococcoidia bacterium]